MLEWQFVSLIQNSCFSSFKVSNLELQLQKTDTMYISHTLDSETLSCDCPHTHNIYKRLAEKMVSLNHNIYSVKDDRQSQNSQLSGTVPTIFCR